MLRLMLTWAFYTLFLISPCTITIITPWIERRPLVLWHGIQEYIFGRSKCLDTRKYITSFLYWFWEYILIFNVIFRMSIIRILCRCIMFQEPSSHLNTISNVKFKVCPPPCPLTRIIIQHTLNSTPKSYSISKSSIVQVGN